MGFSLKHIPRQKLIALVILASLFIYACVILLLSKGTYDTGDGVSHYLISRYSWYHYYLFLSDWGKPFFTFVSSPFAQFGLKGITFFNILCGLGCSYFTYKIADKLGTPFPYLALIFTFSAPIYFLVVNSGLTEPLFSLMLMLCIWLILNERYNLSAIIFSFLPFVRPEFIFVLPLFLFYYILKRKYLANFLLPAGTVLLSIIGFFYYKDPLWLIHQNPYTPANAYGYGNIKGDFLSYIAPAKDITGLALMLLVILGLTWFAGGEYFKKYENAPVKNDYFMEEVILIYGGYFYILLAHTIVWATGIFATLGLLRYMAPLIPFAAIIGLRGLQLINIIPGIFKQNYIKVIIAICFAILVLYSPFVSNQIPLPLDREAVVIEKVTNWLKETHQTDKKIFYLAPYLNCSLGIDPFDEQKHGDLGWMNSNRPDQDMPPGTIMIWDSHYAANEGHMKLDTLMKNPNLTLLKEFQPEVKFGTIGGMDYGIWIFKRK